MTEAFNPKISLSLDVIARSDEVVYLRLPKELQASCGRCDCDHCKGAEGFWDALAVPIMGGDKDRSWTVHLPSPRRSGPKP